MNILDLRRAKTHGRKLTMLTCYDFWTAKILAGSAIDMLLVGDSASMVMHGEESTVPSTMEQQISHTRAVARGAPGKFIVGDLPFLSYRIGQDEAMRNIQALMQAGAHAVKLEGIRGNEELVHLASEAGVPMLVHLGMTPQSTHQFGGFRVQGREESAAERLVTEAKRAQHAGACCLVIECVPAELAQRVTDAVEIPTIGIGAGPHCDGQVLVLQDMLGASPDFSPRFLRRYADLHSIIRDAANAYCSDVQETRYPLKEESYA